MKEKREQAKKREFWKGEKRFMRWFVERGLHCFFLTVILVLGGIDATRQISLAGVSYKQDSAPCLSEGKKSGLMQSYIPDAARAYENSPMTEEKTLTLYAKAAALVDAQSGRVLYGKDENTQYPMASTTKIMTCIYAIENSNLDDVVEISENAQSQPKTRLGIKAGEQYRLGDLLYALMLESCNDCAVAIAEHVGGTVENFCKEMTVKAAQLGCTQTQFKTPNGLDAQGHYTTAAQIAKIGAYAIQNETFLSVTNTASYTFSELTTGKQHTVHNKNAFLTMYDGAIGIKTGYTSKASYCFVGAVKRDSRTFVSAVLASGWYPKKTYKWQDTKKLMDYGVEQYESVDLVQPSIQFPTIPVQNGRKNEVTLMEEGTARTLLKKSDVLNYEIQLNQSKFTAPVAQNQVAGYLCIRINNEEYKKIPLLTAEECKTWDYGWCLAQTLRRFVCLFDE